MAKIPESAVDAVAKAMMEQAENQKTEDLIARGVVKGLAGAAAQSTESDRDFWLRVYSGPAPHATRVAINHYMGYVRLSFGEQYDDLAPTQFRAAVTLSDFNAYQLWKILGQSQSVQYWIEREAEGAEKSAKDETKADGGK